MINVGQAAELVCNRSHGVLIPAAFRASMRIDFETSRLRDFALHACAVAMYVASEEQKECRGGSTRRDLPTRTLWSQKVSLRLW